MVARRLAALADGAARAAAEGRQGERSVVQTAGGAAGLAGLAWRLSENARTAGQGVPTAYGKVGTTGGRQRR